MKWVNVLEKLFLHSYFISVSNWFGSRSGPTFVGPDLGPYHLQRLYQQKTLAAEKLRPNKKKISVFPVTSLKILGSPGRHT